MTSAFYKSIIDDEMLVFGVKKNSLKAATFAVSKTYSRKALKNGETFLDYNVPSNRCAYLYKYASIHTYLATKYFRKLLNKKEVKSILNKKKKMKICCLGGGPGTDVVGLFKALALFPQYHSRVIEVTVLDICGGWRNSFERIISNLVSGKLKDVPATFIDASNFNSKLIQVNLLNHLPDNVSTILSEADIVCMVKFISAIMGSSASVPALEVIGEKLKIGTVILFIDNFQGDVFKQLTDIAGYIGLKTIIGPLHETFKNKIGFIKSPAIHEREIFGCLPLFATKVSVLGFIKSNESISFDKSSNICTSDKKVVSGDSDDDWDTDDESEESVFKQSNSLENASETSCDKFTQTHEKYFSTKSGLVPPGNTEHDQSMVLLSLMDSLADLVNVLNDWQETLQLKRHCCHCHLC